MKWYNVELPYNTRTMIDRCGEFKLWLCDNDIKHEISGVQGGYVHFEIYASSEQLPSINNALDRIVWFDSI